MTDTRIISKVIYKMGKYIKKEKYKGYDPFDVLNSPFFDLPILKSNKFIRFVSQQIFRRIPINLRPLFLIKKDINPVTLGLVIQAYSYLAYIYPDKKKYYLSEIEYCLNKLIKLRSLNYSGYCWGYNFDWDARYAKIDAYVPTVVATGIITNSLYEYYRIFNDKRIIEILDSAALFIIKDLNRTYENNTFCFSYSPLDTQKVYNATMKAARLLAQAYSLTGKKQYIDEAKKTVQFVVDNQNPDGSWSYSKGDSRTWIDNFHTGYVLDCLDEYMKLSGDNDYCSHLKRGLDFYVGNFFSEEGIPKYYNNSVYPIDSTAAAQSILTLVRFGYNDLAGKVARWMIENMMDEKGYFYYQKHRLYTNKISYMRWSNAWMFCSLSYLIYNVSGNDLV